VGIRSQVGAGTQITDTVVNGCDYFAPRLGIGPNCSIEGAILDKNARIGEGVVIRPFPRGTELNQEGWFVKDGIVVLPKDARIAPGTRIVPDS
jgi:glucose-1-phosphate adenylyltransferase